MKNEVFEAFDHGRMAVVGRYLRELSLSILLRAVKRMVNSAIIL